MMRLRLATLELTALPVSSIFRNQLLNSRRRAFFPALQQVASIGVSGSGPRNGGDACQLTFEHHGGLARRKGQAGPGDTVGTD